LTCGNSSIFTTVSSMNNTKTPCTNDSITSILDQIIPWINLFTRRRIGVSLKLKKAPYSYLLCWSHIPTSFPPLQFVHFGKNDIFTKDGHYIFLLSICFVWGYLSLKIRFYLSWWLALRHLLCPFLTHVSSRHN
jgi:hypothetical protein